MRPATPSLVLAAHLYVCVHACARVCVCLSVCMCLCFFCNPSSSRHRDFINFGGGFMYVCATVHVWVVALVRLLVAHHLGTAI